MGLDNRDYARDGFRSDVAGWGSGQRSRVSDWPVWKKIIAANVIVFVLQIFFTRPITTQEVHQRIADHAQSTPEQLAEEILLDEFTAQELQSFPSVSIVQNWLELDTKKVFQGQIWRLATAGFCHDRFGIGHILFNMLFLYWFGKRLEQQYGASEFCCFYFVSLLASSFAFIALNLYTGNRVPAIGASGAVWGVVALYAMIYPYDRIYVYFLFPVQIRFLALIYFAYDLHPVLLALSGSGYSDGIAHAAHIGGAVFGFAYWYWGFRLSPLLDRLLGRTKQKRWANSQPTGQPRRSGSSGRAKIYRFPRNELAEQPKIDAKVESRLDEILVKISKEGRDSLTDEEVDFLIDASQQLRQGE